jgi:hypothetical protein
MRRYLGQEPQNLTPDRSVLQKYTTNPEMAQMIDENPVFSSMADEVRHEREVTAMRHPFVYVLSGEVPGQQTMPFTILIEQGSSFMCKQITGSCFSFDAVNPSSFPMQNTVGALFWAGRGLSMDITDTRSGRKLTSGFTPAETLLTPGYGFSFIKPLDFRYYFYPNTKLRFDVRNRDNSNRTHSFDISLIGFKIYTPD